MNCNVRGAYNVSAGVLSVTLFLLLMLGARAQQEVVQEVPDNFAMHPAPVQPIPYSHQLHLTLGLVCETCHTGAASSSSMGFPASSTCMACHNTVATDRPSIAQLSEISASGEPIPWQRVYRVLAGVTWSHAPHLEAGVQCGACHGDVAQQETMAMTTSVTAMASCISCHEAHAADTACATCHSWPLNEFP